MRKFLILTGCVALAGTLGAAPTIDDNQGNQRGKKKGGNAQVQQNVAAPNTVGNTKKFKTGPGGGPHYNTLNAQGALTAGNAGHHKNKWQGPVTGQTQTNVAVDPNNPNLGAGKKGKFKAGSELSGQGNAASTKFNKAKFGAQGKLGAGGNYKFQKKQFNLQTNNKQFIVNKYQTVKFNQNYKIAGANKWKGAKYQVFVNYHPAWHDTWWYNSYHPHVVFIYGGWYYWDNSYWYPAWGYAPDSVYAYDGPIYASSPVEDPGQVVANVQSALQEQGYYQGEVDGVLGPQTRAALAEYQSAQGLEPTGLVDEPTLETLGMS